MNNGGLYRSSVEVPVMGMERRVQLILSYPILQPFKGRIRMEKTKSFPVTKRMVWEAYLRIKANKGGAGIDQVSLEDFDKDLKNNLYKLWNRLASGSYFPPPVKEVAIPKGQGKVRLLGIPTVADRIAQTVVKDYLEPTIDPVFSNSSFGYRPKRNAHQALELARGNCWKYKWVIDLDIQNFFDELNHELLLKALRKHTQESWILLYIERWLHSEVVKQDGTKVKREKGVPQGSVIGPLLSNLFLHYAFDKWMENNHPRASFERYADDVIVHCFTEKQARFLLDKITQRLANCKLKVHPEKTKIVHCKDSSSNDNYKQVGFNFLGFTFKPRLCQKANGKIFLGYTPAVSKAAIKKMYSKVKALKLYLLSGKELKDLACILNPMMMGWINYFNKFRPSALWSFFLRIHNLLIKWAGKKYKNMRTSKVRAIHWLTNQYKATPELFAHWKKGYTPTGTRLK